MASQESDTEEKRDVPRLLRNSFAIGEISDMVAYQGFSFLIFTFYYYICGLNVNLVTIVYIIWSIYNALNDPLFGAISDKTKTKRLGGGRRRPWMVAVVVPLAVVMFFLFTPPLGNQIILALYMLLIMSTFDTFYTAYSLNHTSLYPEMFSTDRAREQVGAARRIFMVFGLIIAFALPAVFIGKYTGDPAITIPQYQLTGIVFGGVIAVTLIIHLKWGVNEPFAEKLETIQAPGFFESFKITFKNKKFIIFVGASTTCWYVFTLLPMLMPLYVAKVLGQSVSIMATILLLIAFLSTIPGVLIWTKIDARVGSKHGMAISMLWWAISLLALLFTTNYYVVAIIMIFIGIGLGGPPYFIDRNISNIADDDQITTSCRREASYYGVHAVFVRLAAILVIFSINAVFSYSGWEDASTITGLSGSQVFGVQVLMSVFPAVALAIGLLVLKFFKLGKKEVKEIQKTLREKNAC